MMIGDTTTAEELAHEHRTDWELPALLARFLPRADPRRPERPRIGRQFRNPARRNGVRGAGGTTRRARLGYLPADSPPSARRRGRVPGDFSRSGPKGRHRSLARRHWQLAVRGRPARRPAGTGTGRASPPPGNRGIDHAERPNSARSGAGRPKGADGRGTRPAAPKVSQTD